MFPIWILVAACFSVSAAGGPGRIIGGSPVTIEQYPAMVQIEMFETSWTQTWVQVCAGNILTTRTILSVAQCFYGNINDILRFRRVRAGATYRNYGGVLRDIEIVFIHPTYDFNLFDGDVSIVRLRTPLVYSPVIQQTAIPPQGAHVPDNFPVVIAGWGYTEEGGWDDGLRHVQVYTVNNRQCAERYASLPSSRPPVTQNMICAGILDVGGRDACRRDSGGPMYFGNITVGLLSWGEGCAHPTFPGISTAVSSYTNWIVAHAV